MLDALLSKLDQQKNTVNLFYFWHDPAQIPTAFQKNIRHAAEAFPEWDISVLGDTSAAALLRRDWPDIAAVYDRIWIPAVRSDIARMAALYAYGGWYIDADTIPVGDLRPLAGQKNVIVFRDNRDLLKKRGDVMNGFLYMPKGSALAEDMLHRIARNIRKKRDVYRVMSFAGPYLLAELIRKNHQDDVIQLWQSEVYKRYNTELVGDAPLFEHVIDNTASSWRIIQNFGVMPGLEPNWPDFPAELRPRFVRILRDFTETHGIEQQIIDLAAHRPAYAETKGFSELVKDCQRALTHKAASPSS